MIINIILKELNREEQAVISKLALKNTVKNYDLHYKNKMLRPEPDGVDFLTSQDKIINYANQADAIIFWGSDTNDYLEYSSFKSLLYRHNTYVAVYDKEDYDSWKAINNEKIFNNLDFKYLSKIKVKDNFYSLDEISFVKEKERVVLSSIKEVVSNRAMIYQMALTTLRQETSHTSLGIFWHAIRDLIFFFTYITFIVLVRGANSSVDGLHIILYLITGLLAWYVINDVYGSGVTCINSAKGLIKKVKFPITIIPFYSTLTIFLKRLTTYVIVFTIMLVAMIGGAKGLEFHLLKFIYYTFSLIMFSIGFTLLMSAFVGISRDFHELFKAFVRIQLYFNPIFWDITTMNNVIKQMSFAGSEIIKYAFLLIRINPTVYILCGYRESFGAQSHNTIFFTIIFWIITLLMFLAGFKIQNKVRYLYADVI